jgi:hypothetical protein
MASFLIIHFCNHPFTLISAIDQAQAELRITSSDKRLLSVDWHPLASGTLYTTAADKTVAFCDVEAGGTQFSTLPSVSFL